MKWQSLATLGVETGLWAEMQRKPRYPEEGEETAKGREQIHLSEE